MWSHGTNKFHMLALVRDFLDFNKNLYLARNVVTCKGINVTENTKQMMNQDHLLH